MNECLVWEVNKTVFEVLKPILGEREAAKLSYDAALVVEQYLIYREQAAGA
jgi:hypothetical protein